MLRISATETTPLYPPASEGRQNRYPPACGGTKGGVLCTFF